MFKENCCIPISEKGEIATMHCIANTYQEHQTYQILANSTREAPNLERNKSWIAPSLPFLPNIHMMNTY